MMLVSLSIYYSRSLVALLLLCWQQNERSGQIIYLCVFDNRCRCDSACSQCTEINEPCPVQSYNTCLWRETGTDRFMFLYEYCLRLVVHSPQGTTSHIWTVPVRQIGILCSFSVL